jgi:hypothetical protein
MNIVNPFNGLDGSSFMVDCELVDAKDERVGVVVGGALGNFLSRATYLYAFLN